MKINWKDCLEENKESFEDGATIFDLNMLSTKNRIIYKFLIEIKGQFNENIYKIKIQLIK